MLSPINDTTMCLGTDEDDTALLYCYRVLMAGCMAVEGTEVKLQLARVYYYMEGKEG